MKDAGRNILESILCNDLLMRAVLSLNSHKLKILYYHRVMEPGLDDLAQDPGMFITQDNFDGQMKMLRENFCPVSEVDVVSALEGGPQLPPQAVWVTFDDGYKDNFVLAAPVLKKYRITATFFLTTDYIDQEVFSCEAYLIEAVRLTRSASLILDIDGEATVFGINACGPRSRVAYDIIKFLKAEGLMTPAYVQGLVAQLKVPLEVLKASFMNWDDVRHLVDQGFFMGAHTVTHRNMGQLTPENVAREIFGSKHKIEEKTGKKVISFAYPFGKRFYYKAAVSSPFLAEAGIKVAATTYAGLNVLRAEDRFLMRRFDLGRRRNPCLLKFKLATGCFWQDWLT